MGMLDIPKSLIVLSCYNALMQNYRALIPYFPLSVLVFLGAFYLLEQISLLPSPLELTELLGQLYEEWGFIMLFVGAVFETIAYFGLYFPGAVIILLSVILSSGDVYMFATIGALVTLGSTCGSCVSYLIGYYGGKHFLGCLLYTSPSPRDA